MGVVHPQFDHCRGGAIRIIRRSFLEYVAGSLVGANEDDRLPKNTEMHNIACAQGRVNGDASQKEGMESVPYFSERSRNPRPRFCVGNCSTMPSRGKGRLPGGSGNDDLFLATDNL